MPAHFCVCVCLPSDYLVAAKIVRLEWVPLANWIVTVLLYGSVLFCFFFFFNCSLWNMSITSPPPQSICIYCNRKTKRITWIRCFNVLLFYLFVLLVILLPNDLFVFVTAGEAGRTVTLVARSPAGWSALEFIVDTWVLSKFCLNTTNMTVSSLLLIFREKNLCDLVVVPSYLPL